MPRRKSNAVLLNFANAEFNSDALFKRRPTRKECEVNIQKQLERIVWQYKEFKDIQGVSLARRELYDCVRGFSKANGNSRNISAHVKVVEEVGVDIDETECGEESPASANEHKPVQNECGLPPLSSIELFLLGVSVDRLTCEALLGDIDEIAVERSAEWGVSRFVWWRRGQIIRALLSFCGDRIAQTFGSALGRAK